MRVLELAIASAAAWKASLGESVSMSSTKKRAGVRSFSTEIAAQSD
jgi:hypothetical protein